MANGRRAVWGCFVVLAVVIILGAVSVGALMFWPGLATPGVGVLEVNGVMYSEKEVIADLESLMQDPGLKALVVKVDSPGGVAPVAEQIYRALLRVKEEKIPIVASMGSFAASGGYLVSCAADHIYAYQTTFTGSIGVISMSFNVTDLMDKLGVKADIFATGEYKKMTPFEPLTDAQKGEINGLLNQTNDFFLNVVAKGRHMDVEKVKTLAGGRIFLGEEAVKQGLVDEIGDLQDATNYAAKQAKMGPNPRVIRPGKTLIQSVIEEVIKQIM